MCYMSMLNYHAFNLITEINHDHMNLTFPLRLLNEIMAMLRRLHIATFQQRYSLVHGSFVLTSRQYSLSADEDHGLKNIGGTLMIVLVSMRMG